MGLHHGMKERGGPGNMNSLINVFIGLRLDSPMCGYTYGRI